MESREEELERLIREQKRDDYPFQRPEPHAVIKLDPFHEKVPEEQSVPCPVHGLSALRRWGGRDECRECHRERKELARRMKGVQPRRRGCARHGFKHWRVTPKGRGYCTVEHRWSKAIHRRKVKNASRGG